MGIKSESGIATIALGGTIIVLSIVSVALRFWVRIFTKAGLKLDDWLILSSVILAVVTAALIVWDNSIDTNGAYVLDVDNPMDNITAKDLEYKYVTWIIALLYFAIVSTTKLGILIMYHRLFKVRSHFRTQVIVMCSVVLAFWFSCTVASLTNFVPNIIDPRWCRYRGGPLMWFGCFDYNLLWVSAGAIEVFIDIVILAMPIQVIAFLQMSVKQKITLSLLFLLGAFVVVTGLLKTVLGYIPGSGFPSYSKTEIWSTVHVGIAIVSACLPIFKPLLLRIGSSTVASWLPSLISAIKNNSILRRQSEDSV